MRPSFSGIGPCGANPSVYELSQLVCAGAAALAHEHFVHDGACQQNSIIKMVFSICCFANKEYSYKRQQPCVDTHAQCSLSVADKEHGRVAR